MEQMQTLTAKLVELHNTPKYIFWKRKKLKKEIAQIQYDIRSGDIFRVSGGVLSYLMSTLGSSSEELKKITLSDGTDIVWTDSSMDIYKDDLNITFHPKLNRFSILEASRFYTIYKNTPTPRMLSNDWDGLVDFMKERYLESITYITYTKFIL